MYILLYKKLRFFVFRFFFVFFLSVFGFSLVQRLGCWRVRTFQLLWYGGIALLSPSQHYDVLRSSISAS